MLAKSLEGEMSLGGSVLATLPPPVPTKLFSSGFFVAKDSYNFGSLNDRKDLWKYKVFHKTEDREVKSGKSHVTLEGQ